MMRCGRAMPAFHAFRQPAYRPYAADARAGYHRRAREPATCAPLTGIARFRDARTPRDAIDFLLPTTKLDELIAPLVEANGRC